ncbi:hypothetical protein BU17DRAFT_91843 [Hysterangium stoloniferum]|nr:hypothetical protein BU17DRAFT_91843 [Hysterangium stoloniferum]
MSFNTTQSSGSACLLDYLQAEGPIRCPITPDMVASLNLADNFDAFFSAYCLNPQRGDHCPYGYCPNSEVAGPLVRLSAYATNFFVAILIICYERKEFNERKKLNELNGRKKLNELKELKDMFWVQLFGIYSLLLTMRSSLWKRKHHLESVVGKGKRVTRGFVLLALFIWIGLNVYILLPPHLSDFQQEACERNNRVVEHFLFLPVLIVVDMPHWAQCLAVLPFVLTVVTWITVILIKRRKIWPKGEAFTPLTFWGDIKKHYPFVHFVTIVLIPTAYWIATIEVGVLKAGTRDNHLSASFGQVLAMFVAVPPFLSVLNYYGEFKGWFFGLTWVRLLTTRKYSPEHPPAINPSTDTLVGPEKVPATAQRLKLTLSRGESFLNMPKDLLWPESALPVVQNP